MHVKECMNKHYKIIRPQTTLRQAAKIMSECECGYLPVGEHHRLVGAITERHIVMHGLAIGCNADHTRVDDVMAEGVHYCHEDDDAKDATEHMLRNGAEGLIVLSKDSEMKGIFTLDSLTRPFMPDMAQALVLPLNR